MNAPLTPADEALTGMLQELPGTIDTTRGNGPVDPPPAKAPAQPGDPDDIERGDIHLATRFVSDHTGRVLFCPSWDRWHIWDGKRWKADEDGAVMRLAEETMLTYARELLDEVRDQIEAATRLRHEAAAVHANPEASEESKADADKKLSRANALLKGTKPLRSLAESIQSRKKMLDMIELAKTRADLVVRGDQLDADPWLLNCDSGVIDLRDGRVYKHDPKRLITRLCAAPYDAAAKPGRLQEIFDHLFQKDPALIAFAQEVLGNSMLGTNRLEKFYIWFGPGGGGKGALMEGLKAAVGDYCMTAEYKTFISVQGHRVRDDLARLAEARLVLSSEVKKGETWDTAVLKSMTGNDTVTSRQLYGSYFEFRPRLTLHLQCNDLPRADDQDSGLWRRVVVIPCGPQIAEDKQDPTLKDYLLDPQRGGKALLAWLVAGVVRTHSARRLVEPDVVKAATQKYRQSQDPLKEYFSTRLRFALTNAEHHERTRVLTTDVVKDYNLWAGDMSIDRRYRCGRDTIIAHLESRGCWRKKVRTSATQTADAWHGVTLCHADHVLGASTFMPGDEEHEAALESVPLFLCSVPLEKSPRARARNTSREDTFISRENKGTKEQIENQDPPGDPPADGQPIDLGKLP